MKKYSEEERIGAFWSFVNKSDDCWTWTGAKTGGDRACYGVFWNGLKQVYSHRFAYEITNGQIPNGMQIDHICRNRGCVRPDHLRVVSSRENTLCGVSPPAINSKKTHCKNGHVLEDDRACRICSRANWRRYYRRRKSVNPSWR